MHSSEEVHFTFTTLKANFPPVTNNDRPVPQAKATKYLGMHMYALTCKKHTTSKKTELNIKVRNMYWLMDKKSWLSLINKLLT